MGSGGFQCVGDGNIGDQGVISAISILKWLRGSGKQKWKWKGQRAMGWWETRNYESALSTTYNYVGFDCDFDLYTNLWYAATECRY